MKLFFIMLLLCQFSIAAPIIRGTAGAYSPFGILGLSIESTYPINEKSELAPVIGIGLDSVGTLKTIGVRNLYLRDTSSISVFNRCLFFIIKDCKRYLSFTAYLHHSDGNNNTIKEFGDTHEFHTAPLWMSSIGLGTRELIKSGWFWDIEISKRFLVHGGKVTYTKGPIEGDYLYRHEIEKNKTAFGFSLSVGRQF